jgi:Asp-tRNA(Asn)/Glu-tRNA(Gln) amidotransferase A subunit family amidase
MALSWTQDRLGPLCRYAEDCAAVMSVIAKPDNRDMSVSDIPFNWNAHFDIRKLRIGYLEGAFDETRDPVLKKNDEKAMAQVEALGVKLVPVKVPEWNTDVSSIGVESGVFFDELIRTNGDKRMTNPGRAAGFRSSRVVPAVEYLQSQRARSMMMTKLAEATAGVDVYLVPANQGGGPPAGRGGRGVPTNGASTNPPAADAGRGRGGNGQRRSIVGRHFNMANLAGYPALNVVNGFNDAGTPTNITFYARPFAEAELLALGKAYQDATGFHTKHPKLEA